MTRLGVTAVGYDPTLRKETSLLRKEYFVSEEFKQSGYFREEETQFFVMRCVLPHIVNPMEFIDKLFDNFANSFLYIEFQNIRGIIEKKSWFMFMHDHVNYFSKNSFNDYSVVSGGDFGEWSWVLLQNRNSGSIKRHFSRVGARQSETISRRPGRDWAALLSDSQLLIKYAEVELHNLSELVKETELLVYSAAGKGCNFSFAANNSGLFSSIRALDISPMKTNKFMECSGVKIVSLESLSSVAMQKSLILILNREHEKFVHDFYKGAGNLITLPIN